MLPSRIIALEAIAKLASDGKLRMPIEAEFPLESASYEDTPAGHFDWRRSLCDVPSRLSHSVMNEGPDEPWTVRPFASNHFRVISKG